MKIISKWLIILLYIALSDGLHFRSDYNYIENINGWIKYHQIANDWNYARKQCFLEGSVLASPINENMLNAMLTAAHLTNNDDPPSILEKKYIYTGIHAIFSEGVFYSLEGISLDKINHKWSSDVAPVANKDMRLVMKTGGSLDAVSASLKYPYICYKKNDSVIISSDCGTIDKEYRYDTTTGSCYKFHRNPETWSQAYRTCSAEKGYLAIINSDHEKKVLTQLFANNSDASIHGAFVTYIAHLGFLDWTEHGEWWTIHG